MRIELSLTACALVTSTLFAMTFNFDRWWGMKMMMNLLDKKMRERDE